MHPIRIKKTDNESLLLTWSDGLESEIPLRLLRDSCPCATCAGETVLFQSSAPAPPPQNPEAYRLAGITQVGSYAVQVSWGDGHSSGIYPWDRLRRLCDEAANYPKGKA